MCIRDRPGSGAVSHPAAAAAAGAAVVPEQARNNASARSKLKGGPVHQALAARRSREFNRADTDLLPATVTLEYDEEDELENPTS